MSARRSVTARALNWVPAFAGTTIRLGSRGLLPAQSFPGQVLLRLDEVDHREVGVLALPVEADLAGGDLDVLELAELLADRLRVLRAAAHCLGHQQDRVVGVGVDVRWGL